MITGLTSGTFDLFHHSHLLFLERCKAECDKLIVGVDSNYLTQQTKGPKRPIHDGFHRFNMIQSLSMVDIAFILNNVKFLTQVASDFAVNKVFKCARFKDKKVYGAEKAELVIFPDLSGMVSTSDIIKHIMQGVAKPIRVHESKDKWYLEIEETEEGWRWRFNNDKHPRGYGWKPAWEKAKDYNEAKKLALYLAQEHRDTYFFTAPCLVDAMDDIRRIKLEDVN